MWGSLQLEIQKAKVELDGKVVLMLILYCFVLACYSTRKQNNILISDSYPWYFHYFLLQSYEKKDYKILIFHLLSFCGLFVKERLWRN